MRLDIDGFMRTKRRLSSIHDLCSVARFDPATTPERLAEVAALEDWLCGQRYDQGHPNGPLHDEASRRAFALFGDRDLLRDVSSEPLASIEPAHF